MGCWNETCLLTRLPIQYGEKAVAIIIAPTNSTADPCLAEDNFIPVAAPIFGKYDDYGRLENLEDPCNTLTLLRDLALRTGENAEAVLNINEKDDAAYAERLIDIVHSGDAILHTPVHSGMSRPDYRKLYVVFILREFYEFAVESRHDLPARLNGDMLACYGASCLSLLKPRHAKTLKASDMQSKAMADLLKLNAFMNANRIAWAPTCGSGSQTSLENRYQLQFHQMIAERAQDIYLTSRDDSDDED